jgi:hypothetical protein
MSDLNLNTPTPAPTPTPSSPVAEVAELKQAYMALQSEAFNLRLVLLIVVLALTAFFWREASYNKFEVSLVQPQAMQAAQFIESLNKQNTSIANQMQLLQGIVNRLGEYAKVHPDYAQIMAKYGVAVSAPAPAGTAAKPATPPAPAKK